MSAVSLPLRFQIGARTLASVRRRLVRVAWSLEDVLAERQAPLPPLGPGADGYLLTSLPEGQVSALPAGGWIAFVRQRYTRYWTDLSIGHEGWLATLSGNSRSGLKRKAKKLAQASGGALDVRRYATPGELAAFLPIARRVSVTTYQERLLGAGLPDGGAWVREVYTLAAADRVRAWLLFVEGVPVAYLFCTAEGGTLRYDHVGHDPAWSDWSPGSVLMAEAFRDLFGEGRFARFDFTEGEGQHKRQFATGGAACADLLLLRRTLANRAAVVAFRGFDGAVALAKRAAATPTLKRWAKRVRR